MSDLKTQSTDVDPFEFIESVPHPQRKADALIICKLMEKLTGEAPLMWGPSIVGFGQYRLRYPNGREIDWMLCGFSPRKQNLSIYIMSGFDNQAERLAKLGKHKTGASCLYINKLQDVDMEVLEEMIAASVAELKTKQPEG